MHYEVKMEKRDIPYLALGGVYSEDDVQAACSVITDAAQPGGNFFPQPEENEFQTSFAGHEGALYAVAVNSAGTALDLCMMALDIKSGDEVITTPLTFICTATTAMARGAKAIMADIDPATLNLDPGRVENLITPLTRAIIPVHFAGLSCNCASFEKMSKKYGIPVIYDAAHAVSTKYQGIPVGGMGKASCYSFQSNKNMTTLGEGGAVTTSDPEFAEIVRQMKTFGFIYGRPTRAVRIGFNYRMTKPQLAVGLNQLKKIDSIIARKRKNFLDMNKSLEGIDEIIPAPGIDDNHGALMHVIRLDTGKVSFTRDMLTARLKSEWGIGTVIHYPPVWSWEVMEKAGYSSAGCPEAEKACSQVFSLPVFAQTTNEDITYIAEAIKESIFQLK
jgi:perosamine synthetase